MKIRAEYVLNPVLRAYFKAENRLNWIQTVNKILLLNFLNIFKFLSFFFNSENINRKKDKTTVNKWMNLSYNQIIDIYLMNCLVKIKKTLFLLLNVEQTIDS